MADNDLRKALQLQLNRYEAAVAEFHAIEAQLKQQPISARVSDLIRINRETINAMARSAEMVKERLAALPQRAELDSCINTSGRS